MSSQKCRQCQGTHHTTLHQGSVANRGQDGASNQANGGQSEQGVTSQLQGLGFRSTSLRGSRKLLMTVAMDCKASSGPPVKIRTLIDPAAEALPSELVF